MIERARAGQVGRAHHDVAIVGAGVIGLSAAWQVARRGPRVVVVDPAPGQGASWVAAGMLAPVTEAHFGEEPLVELLLAGERRWPGFAADLEHDSALVVGYRRCGTVVVGADSSDRRAIDDVLAFQQSLGLEAERLSASRCRELEPALAPGIAGGANVPGDHQVDNRALLAALLAACDHAGVDFVAAMAREVTTDQGGRAVGVELADGTTVAAGAVLVAAGAASSALLGDGVVAVRPVKGHIVRLRGDAGRPLLSRTVRGLVGGRPCYLVPRADGSVVVGATSEERGFDRTVQLGPVFGLLEDARRLVPGLDELVLDEALAGLRPATPDNVPCVGRTPTPGLLVASGHYRNGILLAPLTAETVVSLLEGAQSSAPFTEPGPAQTSARGPAQDPAVTGGAGGTRRGASPAGRTPVAGLRP